jgi:hypothetical protein
MPYPNSNPPRKPPSTMGNLNQNYIPVNYVDSPRDTTLLGGGFDATNAILSGESNEIINSRRCTILGGSNNSINEKYNTHIIGDFVNAGDNSVFYVGCLNGLFSIGDVVAYHSSDENLKDNIKNPLSKILSLDAVEFDWNNKQSTHKGHDIGLIAQQVELIAPEIVTTRSSGYKAIKYEKLTSLLVGAIKEQQEQINVLSDRVESLLKKLDSMS